MTKNYPVRTCAACRTRRSQVVLVRVVRKPDGTVCIDTARHRSAGRGAYLCRDSKCLELAEKRRTLQRALHGIQLPVDFFDELRRFIAQNEHVRCE